MTSETPGNGTVEASDTVDVAGFDPSSVVETPGSAHGGCRSFTIDDKADVSEDRIDIMHFVSSSSNFSRILS